MHIVDISDPRAPRIKNVIEGEEVKEKLGLSAPHTVHCMPGDIVTISMLGDADGNTPGGFAVLDARDFSIAERWEREPDGLEFMYDFWYQPRQNTLISSEWAAPNTFLDGFNPGRCGRRQVRAAAALLGSRAAGQGADDRSRRRRPDPVGDPLAARSRLGSGVRGRDPVEQHHPLRSRQRELGGCRRRSTSATRSSRAGRWKAGSPG